MITWRLCASLGLAILLVFISACEIGLTDLVFPTGPSLRPSEFRATGFVEDDGCLLPPPAPSCRRLSGVTVEAIGRDRRTTTDAVGRFDLGSLPSMGVGNIHALRGSLPGWTTATGYIGMEYIDGVSIRMGQEPHVLFGWVNLDAGFPRPPASNARVEIVDGPNAGKVTMTDSEGRFVFDDLITSPEFRIEASKSGYASVTVVQLAGLSRNGYVVGLYLKRID